MAERDTVQHSSLVRWTQEVVVTVMDEAVLLGYLDINIRYGAGVTVLRRITHIPSCRAFVSGACDISSKSLNHLSHGVKKKGGLGCKASVQLYTSAS